VSDVLEIRVKKSHVAVLSVVILVASASAAVNVRDSMNVFGNLDMQNNVIQNPQDIRFEGDGTVTKQVDLDGDGDFDFNDAVELAFASSENKVDFNRDGEKDFDDVVAMAYAIGTQRSFDPDTGEATFTKYNSLGRFNSLSTALSWYSLNPNINEQGPKNVSIRSDLDLQGNNIYNVGNLNTGNGGDGEGSGDRYLPEKPATQNVDMNDHKIRNLADPVTDSEAATKGYVDAQTGSGNGGTTDLNPEFVNTGQGFSGDESKSEVVRSIDTDSAVILGARTNYDFRRDGSSGCRDGESFSIKAIHENGDVTAAEGRNVRAGPYSFRESTPVDTINFTYDVNYGRPDCDGSIDYSVYYVE
jgi:hypothetical protein